VNESVNLVNYQEMISIPPLRPGEADSRDIDIFSSDYIPSPSLISNPIEGFEPTSNEYGPDPVQEETEVFASIRGFQTD